MPREIVLQYKGQQARFSFVKLDRSKLYGKRKRIPLDSDNAQCERAELTDDGGIILRSGMTAQGYFDEAGSWVPNKELTGIDTDGNSLEKFPSTLNVPCEITEATPEEVLDLRVNAVYVLDPEDLPDPIGSALAAGSPYSFAFNYRADYSTKKAILIANDDGYFALVGNPVECEWLDLKQPIEETFDDDTDDDLDFEMF